MARLEPIGLERFDWYCAAILAALQNQWAKEAGDVVTVQSQLLLFMPEEQQRQTQEDKLAVQAEMLKHFAMLRNAQLEVQNGNRN